ncbi:MAG: hypothetical protein ACLRSW_15445 [Christensenellaceae bacterium]
MLSGETAAGSFPWNQLKQWQRCGTCGKQCRIYQAIDHYAIKNSSEALSHSACTLARI